MISGGKKLIGKFLAGERVRGFSSNLFDLPFEKSRPARFTFIYEFNNDSRSEE